MQEKGLGIIPIVIITAIVVGVVVGTSVYMVTWKGEEVTEKPGTGFKLIVTDAGSGADPYHVALKNGACMFVNELGCEVQYWVAGGDIAEHLDMIGRAIATADVDAILTPIEDTDAYDDLLQEAIDKGIIVVSFDDDDPTPNPRQAFIGEDLHALGLLRGEWLDEYIEEGDTVLIVAEDPGAPWSQGIMNGYYDYFTEKGKTINWDLLEVGFEVPTIQKRVTEYLVAHPDINGIMNVGFVSGNGAVLAEEEIEGIQPGDIPIVSAVSSDIDIRGIKEGYVVAASHFSATSVGLIAFLQCYNAWKYDIAPFDLTITHTKVTQANVGLIEECISRNIF